MEELSGGSGGVSRLPTIPPTIITVGDREKKIYSSLYTSLILSIGDKSGGLDVGYSTTLCWCLMVPTSGTPRGECVGGAELTDR